jgi:hypothetical protein
MVPFAPGQPSVGVKGEEVPPVEEGVEELSRCELLGPVKFRRY